MYGICFFGVWQFFGRFCFVRVGLWEFCTPGLVLGWKWCGILYSVMSAKVIGYSVVLVLVLGVAVWGLWHLDQQAAPKREAYRELAQCLSEKGVVFYGAYWCPACAQQKTMFGGVAKQLPYVECSLPDRTQNELCSEAEIANYPVWEFDGGYRCGGVVSPEVLAHVSGCALPAYDGLDNTPLGLYERLVVTASQDSLRKRGVPQDDIDEYIATVAERVNAYLTEQYGSTVATATDPAHLLAAFSEVLHGCALYEKQVVEAPVSEGVEVELVPEDEVDLTGGEA